MPRKTSSTPSKNKKGILSASEAAKKARAGEDMGKPGKMFDVIAAKAAKRYGSKERGEKVAGAVFQKLQKQGKL